MALSPNEQDFIMLIAGIFAGFGTYAALYPPPSIPSPYGWVVPFILWVFAAFSFALQYALGVTYPTTTISAPNTPAKSAMTTQARKILFKMRMFAF